MKKWGKVYDHILMYTCVKLSNQIIIKMPLYMTTFLLKLKLLAPLSVQKTEALNCIISLFFQKHNSSETSRNLAD